MKTAAIVVSLVAVLAMLAMLASPSEARAHPLGNFTVNRYAGIEIAGRDVYLRYALDLAEIPTIQLGGDVRKPGYAASLAAHLQLSLDSRLVPLEVVERRVVSRPGAGGLETLRLDVVYRAVGSGTTVAFEDRGFPGRIGWREVTVSAREGARILESSVPPTSESDALTAYPGDLLRSPLDVSSATATVELGAGPGVPPAIGPAARSERVGGGFEALVHTGDLSLVALLGTFLAAAFWGAAHALTPGHGKALVAAYLVGTKGTPRHAFILGGTVTVTHTAGVFALGLVTLGLTQFVLPEQIYPWLTLVSGLLVVAVGASVLSARARRSQAQHRHHDGQHHHHGYDHAAGGLSSKGILGVGVAAGLLPCPSALVVLLSAIALHRVGLGLALVVAFSIGLAATITAIGLVAVLARRAFGRLSFDGPVMRALPAASAGLILAVGIVMVTRAVPGVL